MPEVYLSSAIAQENDQVLGSRPRVQCPAIRKFRAVQVKVSLFFSNGERHKRCFEFENTM